MHPRLSRRLFLDRVAARLQTHLQKIQDQAWRDPDRGEVVSNVIIVAGFAVLAVTIYLAVSGKVHAWIAKIPSGTGSE